MTAENALKEMLARYIKGGIPATATPDGGVALEKGHLKFTIPPSDVAAYAATADARTALLIKPVDCCICSGSSVERLVLRLDAKMHLRVLERGGLTFGDEAGLRVVIGDCSPLFFDHFRFNPVVLDHMDLVSQHEYGPFRDPGARSLKELVMPFRVIRAENLSAASPEQALKVASRLFDACLFQLAYSNGWTYRLRDGWDLANKQPQPRMFLSSQRQHTTTFSLPRFSANEDIVRFYQFGCSSDIAMLKYLAFYQVLEYFFLTVSDGDLHERLRRQLFDPAFHGEHQQLRDLVFMVFRHGKHFDETEMLKSVLAKYTDREEIVKFINEYESWMSEKVFTAKTNLFGSEAQVSLSHDHLFGTLAKRIKTIRNALVHSTDRYENAPRHVPFSEESKVLEKEVPLMQFLAERIVIATAEPLQPQK